LIRIDTNILIRAFVNDDPEQFARAGALLAGDRTIFVTKTVLLESEWVLRSRYGFDPRRVTGVFRSLLGLPNVRVEAPEEVATALALVDEGLDFADALHVASAADIAPEFLTFDRALLRAAERLGLSVREP
jgi:predicted nucleic-acid-binding protein